MFGIDYSGITNNTLSIEVVNRHLNDYQASLANKPNFTKENEAQIAIRYTGSFLREKLKLVALASILGKSIDNGGFFRGSEHLDFPS